MPPERRRSTARQPFRSRVATRLIALAALLLVGGACASEPGGDEAGQPALAGPTAESETLWGMYLYMADAAVFTDCGTGEGFPVELHSVGIDVERAYLDQRPGPGRPLLASLTGRFVMQSSEPGARRTSPRYACSALLPSWTTR